MASNQTCRYHEIIDEKIAFEVSFSQSQWLTDNPNFSIKSHRLHFIQVVIFRIEPNGENIEQFEPSYESTALQHTYIWVKYDLKCVVIFILLLL